MMGSLGSSSLPKKGAESPPQFSAHIHCGHTAGWIKMALRTKVGLGPGHVVLGTQIPSPKRRQSHQFWPTSIVAKWLDASRCHFVWRYRPQPRRLCVRWGPRPSPKRGRSPQFSELVYCAQTASCMYHETTWYGDRPHPRRFCVRWGQRGTAPFQFSANVGCGQTA